MQESVGEIISMERLHEIVNSGVLCHLCTCGVFDGARIRAGQPDGEYTLWNLEYIDGQHKHLYTLN